MRWRILLMLMLVSVSVGAETVPLAAVKENPRDNALWEVGVIGADLYQPDYPAAGQKHARWLVAPYAIYRGNILRADREGARARLVQGRWADVEMSFAASFASHSKDNEARQGMPDLDYLLEMGPRLSILLSDWGGRGSLRFMLPVRAVFSTDLGDFRYQGYTFSPSLYSQVEPILRPHWIGLTQLAGRFSNRSMNAYFYEVSPDFARPDRPVYDARSGYVGSDLFMGVAIPFFKRWRLFAGGQVYCNAGSANSASPLYKREFDYSAGLGLSFTLYYSKSPARL